MVVDGVRVHSVRVNGIVVFDDVPRTSDVRITDNHVAMDWPSIDEVRRYGGVHPGYGSDYFDGVRGGHRPYGGRQQTGAGPARPACRSP
ncbi:hypothetical protein O7614_05005 [Micromonospora sp. WMMD961]|uniref:hypothetical protein n=1 Tax=Micromonospora sp. WMMD961 TaxID=3016100 RepID=UPI002417E393|nr:hypothetical protein [Micromonospora sp. WMMD961]MDG4779003.1 hypothetical protein [Micromonospora sp. WMMD961]